MSTINKITLSPWATQGTSPQGQGDAAISSASKALQPERQTITDNNSFYSSVQGRVGIRSEANLTDEESLTQSGIFVDAKMTIPSFPETRIWNSGLTLVASDSDEEAKGRMNLACTLPDVALGSENFSASLLVSANNSLGEVSPFTDPADSSLSLLVSHPYSGLFAQVGWERDPLASLDLDHARFARAGIRRSNHAGGEMTSGEELFEVPGFYAYIERREGQADLFGQSVNSESDKIAVGYDWALLEGLNPGMQPNLTDFRLAGEIGYKTLQAGDIEDSGLVGSLGMKKGFALGGSGILSLKAGTDLDLQVDGEYDFTISGPTLRGFAGLDLSF